MQVNTGLVSGIRMLLKVCHICRPHMRFNTAIRSCTNRLYSAKNSQSMDEQNLPLLERLKQMQVNKSDVDEKEFVGRGIDPTEPPEPSDTHNILEGSHMKRILDLHVKDPLVWNAYVLGRIFKVPENKLELALKFVLPLETSSIIENSCMFSKPIERSILYRADEIRIQIR